MGSPLSCAVLSLSQLPQLRASQVVESSELCFEANLHEYSCCWTEACPPAGILDQNMGGVAAGMASVRGTIPSAAGELSDRYAHHYPAPGQHLLSGGLQKQELLRCPLKDISASLQDAAPCLPTTANAACDLACLSAS